MPIPSVLSFAAAYFSLIVAAAVLYRDRRSFVHRAFAAGMLVFAVEALFRGLSYTAVLPGDVIYWQKRIVAASSLIPAVWLAFSISYARVNAHNLASRWKWSLAAFGLSTLAFVGIFRKSLFVGSLSLVDAARWSLTLALPGRVLEFIALLSSVWILFNLERTIRSSTGRMRWQIKFMVLGVGGLFALRIYLSSQALLFSRVDTGFGATTSAALIAANLLFALSLFRGRSLNMDVYLSAATIRNSLTLILAGVYLLTVGVLAHFMRFSLANRSLPLDALVIFLALTALAVLLLSNRLRRALRLFVSRNFNRPIYDYRNVWMELTRRTTALVDVNELSTTVCRMVSESIEVLSVSVWTIDEARRRLTLAGSTALSAVQAREIEKNAKGAPEFIRHMEEHQGCLDLDAMNLAWPREIMECGAEFFREFSREYRMRYAIGLRAGGELVGVMTLNNDRVGHEKSLSPEDAVLLETLASQLAASLQNLKLSARLRHAREVETFQTVSTFFVHDLKNLASRLSLTMQNLPSNFENPEFRADALRVISTSLKKIDDMCSRLAMLKQDIELKLAPYDLNQLVTTILEEFKGNLKADLRQDLHPVPKAMMDSEKIHKVLTNLVMNASEALNGDGVIHVATIHEGRSVGFAVRDNGCGMTEDFIEHSLFRPFQTTKKKGLGIGLFHSKLIVEAHHGTFEVTSAVGKGTEFRVLLPS